MKGIVLITSVLWLVACTTKPREAEQSSRDSLTIDDSEATISIAPADTMKLVIEEESYDSLADSVGLDLEGAETAILFLNDYVNPKPGSKGWFYGPLLTENFKQAYRDLVAEAKRIDPELGLGFDPVLAAQDNPSAFFIKTFSKSGYVTAEGVDWPGFDVTVRLIRSDSIWMVEAAGVINIPRKKQAPR